MAIKKRILIVDDEPGIGNVLKIQFSITGYEAGATTSGAEAIELIKTQPWDLVLLDALMPVVSGADVLMKVRTFSQVPIIVFTGHADLGKYALKLGANDYISKPFSHDLLMEKVEALLNAGKNKKNNAK